MNPVSTEIPGDVVTDGQYINRLLPKAFGFIKTRNGQAGTLANPGLIQSGSYNIASFDLISDGIWRVEFINDMATTGYSIVANCEGCGLGPRINAETSYCLADKSTTGCNVRITDGFNNVHNPNSISILVLEFV